MPEPVVYICQGFDPYGRYCNKRVEWTGEDPHPRVVYPDGCGWDACPDCYERTATSLNANYARRGTSHRV